jgi:hypothetical protein
MAVTPALSYLTWTGLEPIPAFPLSHQLAELMASWPPLPGHVLDAGRQPVAVVVPSVPLKLNSRSRTIQRAVLSLSQVFSWATEEGTTHAALPPPVVPLPKPSGVPLTPYDCLSPRTAALAVYALASAKIENFILRYEREDAFLKQRRRLIKYKEWLDSVDGTLPVGHLLFKSKSHDSSERTPLERIFRPPCRHRDTSDAEESSFCVLVLISSISRTEGPALGGDRGMVKHQLMALTHPLNDSSAVKTAITPLSSLTAIQIPAILLSSGTVAEILPSSIRGP